MLTCARAVTRIPATAMTSITRPTAAPIAIYAPVLAELEPNTASTDGPSSRTSATVPMMYAAIISHPVRKLSYGLIARPTHSNDAPQFAFHILHRRYAFAMTSIGTAVNSSTGPLPYAVATASAASDSPTVAAGADDAIPITVSCATPIASRSNQAGGVGAVSADEAAALCVFCSLLVPAWVF